MQGKVGEGRLSPNSDKDEVVAWLEGQWPPQKSQAGRAFRAEVVPGARTRTFLKVQDGCRHRCSFCIVTQARGEERSRRVSSIVGDIKDLVAEGVQEVVLSGVHLGGYGSDLDSDLYTLIEGVLGETTLPRLRLGSLEPWDLPDNFFSLWRDPRLMPHLHLPLQSGSDRILKRMGRRCTRAHFRHLVALARAEVPGMNITTDVIVGFPGEDEAAWQETLEFVESIQFGHIHVFSYSPRSGTRAAQMQPQVPPDIKKSRSQSLRDLAATMKGKSLAAMQGEEVEVLWEGPGDPDAASIGKAEGYTPNYLRAALLPSLQGLGPRPAGRERVKCVGVDRDGTLLYVEPIYAHRVLAAEQQGDEDAKDQLYTAPIGEGMHSTGGSAQSGGQRLHSGLSHTKLPIYRP